MTARIAPFAAALALVLAGCAAQRPPGHADRADVVRVTDVRPDAAPRVLCVVAHPDDEIAFAGTLYKTATFLGGACDLLTVTNGEGGFRYATLAERVYGLPLTDETVGRRELPAIRRSELAAGCRWLGVRDVHLLRERDHRYTQDVAEVLGRDAAAWDLGRVARALDARLAAGAYDFVLVHLPTPGTHAHHVAATVLALEAVARMDAARRPAVLGARVVTGGETPAPLARPPAGLPGAEGVVLDEGVPPFVFDRRRKFGHLGRLDYGIVVAWAVAEHKSQGTMQLLAHRGDREEYLLFAGGPPDARARAGAWFEALARPQFEARTYGPSAGENR